MVYGPLCRSAQRGHLEGVRKLGLQETSVYMLGCRVLILDSAGSRLQSYLVSVVTPVCIQPEQALDAIVESVRVQAAHVVGQEFEPPIVNPMTYGIDICCYSAFCSALLG